jgi:MFS family permease
LNDHLSRTRGITLLLIFSWCGISIVYDGHIRYLEYLDSNIFILFTIASSTELPAEILITYTLDIWGRRLSLFFAGTLSSIFSFCAAAMPLDIYFLAFAIISRFFINISYNVSLQFAAELLPTVVRCEGVAFIHIMGNAATFLSPFVAFASRIHYNIPMIILGVVAFISGILTLFLPETLRQQLPQDLMVIKSNDFKINN